MPLNQLNQFSNRALYFGAPIAIFIGVRFLAGGPQSSHASTLPAKLNQGPLPKLLGETPDDAAQKDGQAVALSIQTKLSPFWYDERAELTSFEYTEPEELEPVDQGGPELHVSSILPHPTRPLAVINGKPCRLDERVAPGWKLTKIDGDARTITITNTLGETRVIRISKP
ncbi:MAG: hypothetical protein KC996_10910 [Phycisphaerales bacterium]|nr:hypothetical protein [Phycisphaerales bacterium]